MKVVLGDALEALRSLSNASIDHTITDPPYNISGDEKQTMVGPNIVPAKFGDWDCKTKIEYDQLIKDLLAELLRVSKNGANALLWLDRPYAGYTWFMAEEIGWKARNIIAAVKRNPCRKMNRHNVKSAWEACLWLSKGPVKTCKWDTSKLLDRNVIFYNIGQKVTTHPNEKSEAMIEPLVEMYTNEGDVVLDPFCGSGTTAIVCKKKNRDCIAIDSDPKCIEMTTRRLDTTSKPIF